MTEDQHVKDAQAETGSKTFINKSKDKKTRSQRPLTKIILRRLPPTMTEEQFLEQVSPIPEHDHFYFAKPDPSLGNNIYSRAYINFVNVEDIYLFRDKFDEYVFVDDRGMEYVGIVEYAPFQRIPKKKKKKDPKCGTIESDPVYQEFLESLTKEPEVENQPKLEYSYPITDGNDKKVQSTPLLEYLAARKQDKRGRDERRRRENDKRKMRIERKTKEPAIKEDDSGENEIKKIKPREWEKDKSSKPREEQSKPDNKEGTVYESKTFREQRKSGMGFATDKKKRHDSDKKDDDDDESDKSKIDKPIKPKDGVKEQKSKKYSDTRKERTKPTEAVKADKQSFTGISTLSDGKYRSMNHDDIKPFTQLPQVKTDDLTRIIDGMEKKTKLEEVKPRKDSEEATDECSKTNDEPTALAKVRRSSLDSGEGLNNDDSALKRQNSLDDRGKSTDREGSEEKEKSESTDRRNERRIRNKDRPSRVIYQPGMGKFSKQRLAKEKETQPTAAKSVNDSEKKDT
ncbi:regulator of nonsense transcripts 3B [Cydia strobilella]|uniref:regulator of nonsense transcripts 3B n=1 Tax=Cydia strobilella TaxID=1100964 RepID=UPI00300688EF